MTDWERAVADLSASERKARIHALCLTVRDIRDRAAQQGALGGSRMAVSIVSECTSAARLGIAEALSLTKRGFQSSGIRSHGEIRESLSRVFLAQVRSWREDITSAKESLLSGGCGGYPSYSHVGEGQLEQAIADELEKSLADIALYSADLDRQPMNHLEAIKQQFLGRKWIAVLVFIFIIALAVLNFHEMLSNIRKP